MSEKWREAFPMHWEEDRYLTRREFTKFMVLISGATCLGHGYFLLAAREEGTTAYPSMSVAGVDDIPVGGVKLFYYPTEDDPALLIRLKADEWVAYMQRCTHLSCPVHYSRESGRIECPCHNGAFDPETGEVLEGPPPRPLPKIALKIEGDRIVAEGMDPHKKGQRA
jgi:Rieske Fe-S protein